MRLVRVAIAAVTLTLLLAGPAMAGLVIDMSITKTDSPDPVTAGTNLTYTITATNPGPIPEGNVSVADTVPAGTTFVSLAAPAGWSTTTPPVGGTGNVTATNASMAVGSAVFTLVVQVGAGVPNGTVITNTATVAGADPDLNLANNSATATTDVTAPPPSVAASAAASVLNAATSESPSGLPLTVAGFGAILLALLLATATVRAARNRT